MPAASSARAASNHKPCRSSSRYSVPADVEANDGRTPASPGWLRNRKTPRDAITSRKALGATTRSPRTDGTEDRGVAGDRATSRADAGEPHRPRFRWLLDFVGQRSQCSGWLADRLRDDRGLNPGEPGGGESLMFGEPEGRRPLDLRGDRARRPST